MRPILRVASLAMVLIFASGCASQPPAPAPAASSATAARPTAAPPATAAAGAPSPTPTRTSGGAAEVAVQLSWLGQSTFVLTTGTGFKALLDPAGTGTGYAPAQVSGVDVVTMSHEHSDHNYAALATGSPIVLRGLSGADWAKVDQVVKSVRVRSVGTYHDDTQGSQRGKNAVFVFEADGLRVAHLGDLGHVLTADQVKSIGPVDVVLVPVGGFYTVDAARAFEVVEQLAPRVVVPMHFRTAAVSASLADRLAPVDGFTSAAATRGWAVIASKTLEVTKSTLPDKRTVAVLSFQ